MKWNFSNDRAIYSQIIDQLSLAIVSGALAPGERLLSVRELAAEAGVNPNTMQKALSEMEQTGLVHSSRTAGRFVTESRDDIMKAKAEIARERTEDFIHHMNALGFSEKEVFEIIKEIGSEYFE